jgi:hypothetical protein
MEGGKAKRNYARDFVISFSIALGLFLLIHSRIVKAPNGRMLVWGWESRAWAVLPKTIRMAEGEIFVKFFTPVSYSGSYLSRVRFAERNIQYSFTVLGNQIDQGISSVTFDSFGFVTKDETSFIFKFDKNIFKLDKYEHRAYFEDKNDNDKRDADEALFYERTLYITDFDEITLSDGTVIKNAWPGRNLILMMKKKYTELYFIGDRPYFIVSNPAWDNEKYVGFLEFEPNWGKVIRYEEVKKSDSE